MSEEKKELNLVKYESYEGARERFEKLIEIPKQFEKEVGWLIQIVRDDWKLQKCSRESLMQCLIQVAEMGITLSPIRQEAYLIPRKKKDRLVATLLVSYRGMIRVMCEENKIDQITSQVVYEKDEFKVELGTDNKITHERLFQSKKIVAVYCIAEWKDRKQIEVLGLDDIVPIRGASESYKASQANKIEASVWESFEGEMWRKSAIRRLFKFLPRVESERMDKLVEHDNKLYTLDPNGAKAQFIVDLLENSVLSPERKDEIERLVNDGGVDYFKADKIIEYLKENQVEPLQSGRPMSAKELRQAVEEKVAQKHS